MLDKLSVSVKLYLLLLITATTLAGLGLFGIDDMRKMDENTRSLYTDRVLPIRQLSTIRFEYAVEIQSLPQKVKNHSLTFEKANEKLRQAQEIIHTNWQEYKLTYLTTPEALLVKETDLEKKRIDKACSALGNILAKEDTIALNQFPTQKFLTDSDPFFIKLSSLTDLQVKVGKEILDSNNAIYHFTVKKFFFLIAFCLVFALSLSFYIVKNINKLIDNILHSNLLNKQSEERYRSLFEQASDAIFVANFDGNFTQVNDSMCNIVGYSRQELLSMNIADLVTPELQKINPLIYNQVALGTTIIGERKFVHKNGAVVDIEINGKRVADNRVLIIFRDITERKEAEAELRSSEQKYKLLFESSPVPLSMISKEDLSIIAINEKALELYGYKKEELLNASAAIVRLPEDKEEQRQAFQTEVSGPTDRGITRHLKKDGTIIFVNVIVNDILFEGREVRLVLTNDVTEKLIADEQLRKTEAHFQTILNTTDTAYALLDRDLEVLELNAKALDFAKTEFHYYPENGGKIFDKLPEGRRSQFFGYINEVFKGNSINYEVDYNHQDSADAWYHVRMFPLLNKENNILGLVLAINNITERKTAEQSLQAAYERIKTNITFIRELIWKQSHILRSPVANLKGLISILRVDPTDGEVLEHIDTALERMDTVFKEMAKDSSGDEMYL